MSKTFMVLQGKTFFVELDSHIGSTDYGWCIKSMPAEVIFMGMENTPQSRMPGGIVKQRFYFGAVSAENTEVEIEFALTCWLDLTKTEDTFKAEVTIIPGDSEDFVSCSENEVSQGTVIGCTYSGQGEMKYGYPCSVQEAGLKYGYVCESQDAGLKYGYICDSQTAALKYGYPCGVQDANLKYGYPCGVQDANLKYGYPCGVQEANLKYGYPCGVQDANLKYGYPCDVQTAALKYGYPCGVQEANLKYGYPCGMPGVQPLYGYPVGLKYGYPCMEYTKDARPYGFVCGEDGKC